jgi:hypothetical protein
MVVFSRLCCLDVNSISGSLVLSAAAIYCSSFVVYIYGAIRASRSVHKQLIQSIFGTTLRYALQHSDTA